MIRRLATALIIGVLTTVHVSTAVSTLATVAASESAPSAVERPGEQYRGRHQLHLVESRRLLA